MTIIRRCGSKETMAEKKRGQDSLGRERIVWMEHQSEGKGKAKEMK